MQSLAQSQAQTGAEADAEASNIIMMLMKPFLGPFLDFFIDIILHKPWLVSLGGKKTDDLECTYDDWKPDIAVVTSHRKPNVFNFGHK